MKPEDFDEIDAILDDLRTRFDETPQWEFCEGFMAALIVSRRVIPMSEYLPVLLGVGAPGGSDPSDSAQEGSFKDEVQTQRFMALWMQRWNEIAEALNTEVDDLEDERAYHPEVMDVRGAVARLPEAERAAVPHEEVPAFGQVWAVGFMYAVESWPEEWVPPKDKEARKWLDDALDAIVALTEDDEGEPTISPFEDDGPPTLSVERLEAFGSAVWAVYDLRTLWREVGPRVETVRKTAEPGRNDLCHCGSGKKYKKCHGA